MGAGSETVTEKAPTSNVDSDTTADPDLDLTYEEAVKSEDFRYAEVYSRENTPTDKDKGQLRLDYNDPEVSHTMLIRPTNGDGDEDHVILQTDVVWRVIFPGNDPNSN